MTSEATIPPQPALKTIYQSENFIVVDKNYDVKINSEDENDTVTVATQLAEGFPELADPEIRFKFRYVC